MAATVQTSQVIAEAVASGSSNVQISQVDAEVVWSANAMCFVQMSQAVAEVVTENVANVQTGQVSLEVVYALAKGATIEPGVIEWHPYTLPPSTGAQSDTSLSQFVLGHDPQRHRIVVAVPDNLYTYDLSGGGWGKVDADTPGTITCSALEEQDKDSHLVMGNAAGQSVRVFDPENAPVDWEWRSREEVGAYHGIEGAKMQCSGLFVDWHRVDPTATGFVKATLYVDGVPQTEMNVAEQTNRKYIYGPKAQGHRFALDLVGHNANCVSARYLLERGQR